MRVYFSISGQPQGKARPRFSKRGKHTYTPAKTQAYEKTVAIEYKRQCHSYKFDDDMPLFVTIRAYYEIPKSASKKKAAQMKDGFIRPLKKPDVDNLTKIILDSLNEIAYKDDAQVAECFVTKYYSDKPRVEVIICNIEKEDEAE